MDEISLLFADPDYLPDDKKLLAFRAILRNQELHGYVIRNDKGDLRMPIEKKGYYDAYLHDMIEMCPEDRLDILKSMAFSQKAVNELPKNLKTTLYNAIYSGRSKKNLGD